MHQLITIVGSLVIMTLFICQFQANENTFLRLIAVEEMISSALSEEVYVDEKEKYVRELLHEINELQYAKAKVEGNEMCVQIEGVIGPKGIIDEEDNHLTLKRKLEFEKKESEEDEKSDNNAGDADADGSVTQISASSDTDCS